MAYTPLNLGYIPSAGYEYTSTTDSIADWFLVPNSTYFYDKIDRQVYYKDSNGFVNGASVGGELGTNTYNVSSSQWSKTLPAPISLLNGARLNSFTFFENTNKVLGGTTTYDEYDIDFGISIILNIANISGVANINILGVDYPITFATNNFITATNFVAANQAALNALNVKLFALGSGTDGRIRFSALEATLNAITITNVSGNITGILQNEFTGGGVSVGDHITIPYFGRPYFQKRILHTIRTNFNITIGSLQFLELGLFRYANDTLIGSSILIQRNLDVTGVQSVLETYTANLNDAFVTGGFYVALKNNSGVTIEFIGNSGILIQNIFGSATSFI